MAYPLLSRHTLEKLLEGVELLHSAPTVEEWRSHTWHAIRLLISCDMAAQLTVSFVTGDAVCRVDDQVNDLALTTSYADALNAHVMRHPAMKFDGQDREAALISDFMSLSDYRKTGFYNEIHRPFGINYSAVLGVGLSPQGELLGFSADRGVRDYSEREKQALSLLCRHIRIAHANLGVRDSLLASLQDTGASFVVEASGTLLVDAIGKVVFQNLNGARILRHFFPEHVHSDHMLPSEMLPWIRQLCQLRSGIDPRPWPPFIKPLGSHRLIIRAIPGMRHDQLLLSLFHENAVQIQSPVAACRLTPREQEVLALLCDGLTNREIATRLSVTISTIKTQVANVLRKLGVRNRASAVKFAAGWSRGDLK